MPNGLDRDNWTPEEVAAAHDAALERLFTSDQARIPSTRRARDLIALNDAAIAFGTQILLVCTEPRERALAMTHLEDTLMRARRAVFADIA